jgi:molecular chaperone HtpG
MDSNTAQKFEFKAEMRQLLHLIVNSLYTNPEVFLRELISNASDAINKVRYKELTGEQVLDADIKQLIAITVDEKAHTFSIEDTGIGMTFEDLTERLGTVASSGTMEFIKQLKESKGAIDGHMIGQFGVGFYSAFMVTDRITVETRHAAADSQAYTWTSDGQGTYEITESDRTSRGTKITFTFKEDHKEFANDWKIKSLIRKYSNFVDYSIKVNDEEVNKSTAIWHKRKNETTAEELKEFYRFVSSDYYDYLDHLHLSIEGRVNFKALLFVPKRAKMDFYRNADFKSPQLYSNKVFVMEDCKELLPEYLRFIEGVVDSEDLPLNVSREVTQSSPAMNKIREVLVGKILGMIEGWSDSDPEKYTTFMKEFGALFKSGLSSDFTNRDRLTEILRFHSTRTDSTDERDPEPDFEDITEKENTTAEADGATAATDADAVAEADKPKAKHSMVSFKEYTERMQPDQKEIYFISGESLKEVRRDPKLEYFNKKGMEVLLFVEPIDAFTVATLGKYKDFPITNVASAEIKEKGKIEGAIDKKSFAKLTEVFKAVSDGKLEEVKESRKLVESAVTLSSKMPGMDAHMERMMRMMNQSTGMGATILEVNTAHPLIHNLARLQSEGDEKTVNMVAKQLYEGARLLHGDLDSPADFVRNMADVFREITDARADGAK